MRKEIKDKIRQAFEKETPDMRTRVQDACEHETQYSTPLTDNENKVRLFGMTMTLKKVLLTAACAVLFCVGLIVGQASPFLLPITTKAETIVYVDVAADSGIELSIESQGKVLGCHAGNVENSAMLQGIRLEGVDVETALHTIMGQLYVKGYLGEENNSLLISVDTTAGKNADALLSNINQQVNEIFKDSNIQCAIITQSVDADADLERRAKEQGISVGKMHLVDKLVGSLDAVESLDVAELAAMSIKELNLIYSMRPDRNDWSEDAVSGNVGGYISEERAIAAGLGRLQVAFLDVAWYDLCVLPSKTEKGRLVYVISVELRNDDIVYKYEVDCVTGDILGNSVGEDEEYPMYPQDAPMWRMIR